MKKSNNNYLFNGINLIIFLLYLIKIKAQLRNTDDSPKYEIHIYFNSVGPQILYCDDNIEFFETENLNVYKVGEDGSKINIKSLLKKQELFGFCDSPIIYEVDSVNEKIIMELLQTPNTLKQLFADSTISKIERFDYPFPADGSDYNGMFYHNTELTYIDLTNFSFRQTKDVSNMFYSCTKLETIIFPTSDSSNTLEIFSDMFAFTTQLTSIDLSSLSFVSAKDMGYMFHGCTNLKYVKFPENENADKIEILSDIFADCKNLISLDLSNFNFKNLKNLGYMFNGCINLVSLKLPQGEKATRIQYCKYMFSRCSKLTSIDLSYFSFVNVADLGSFFYDCSSLKTLILPQDEVATNIQDFSSMFQGCENLTSINLSNIDFKNAKKLSYMFYGCTKLERITLPTSSIANKVEEYQGMFLFCENLISVDLSNFSFINARDLSAMFLYCTNLETVILPKNEIAQNVEDISYMFGICFKLKSVDFSGISFANVKDISYFLSNCINLENLIMPSDEEINNIENVIYAFANCHKLVSLDLSKFNFEKVTNFSYLFFSCINLEDLKFSTRKINNIQDFNHAFDNCTKLENIDLTYISMLSAINLNSMFSNCEKLKLIKFPKNENMNNVQEMGSTFANCISLTSLDLSHINIINGNINFTKCFLNCNSLKELNIFNINTKESKNTFNFLENVSLEGCLYHSHDYVNSGQSITNKMCSKYIGFHKCGPCKNYNSNEYCIMNIEGKNIDFYYLDFELELPINERQCYWSKNFENAAGYTFVNNKNKNEMSYYINYCDNYCDECSENGFGCTKCKNNIYPIDTEYNAFLNNINSYFFCYNRNNMKNYFLNEETHLFTKCAEKCAECSSKEDICSKCNYDQKYFKVENQENECWKFPPTENWVLDENAKEWRKCNERCKKCRIQSKSDLDHQCTSCANNYYPYYTDLYNFNIGVFKGLNCWSVEEVALQNRNYYLNGEYFEKCDESCGVCLNKGNNCLECQMNYYFINGFKNGTCFFYPLEKYALGLVDGETVYLPCYSICKYCNQVSQSFLFQQCIECDEINYTLDLYSLNQSYCIPKNNINSYFIKDMEKWYIEDFEGIKDFEITNEKMLLDYQRLLQSNKFQNLTYKRVKECPKNKPYVIFSTRQCVSSCSSKNLIEHGIFMTKKLYEYNNICYDECPNGSEKDDINLTCKEINEYVKTNKTFTKEYYNELRNDIILQYLGDDYAKETVQYIRAPDFSSYHLEVTSEEKKISHMMELKVPIYNFSKCINKLIEYYHLNESENIYVEIMENNDIDTNNIINSTSYKFFKNNGEILNHSCCQNLSMEVKKHINIDNINISVVFYYESMENLGNVSEIENDYCVP